MLLFKMKKKLIIFVLLTTFLSCDKSVEENNGTNTQVHVSMFLYENCPISQYMTLPLNDIYEQFSGEDISFTGYFPNILSTPESISAFQDEYSLLFNCVDDDDGVLVEYFGANVYAEVFVEKDGIIVYQGMVDNSYSALGQWSPADKHYLYDILSSIINDEEIPWASNMAIGCLI